MRIGYDAKRLYNNFTGLGNYSRTLILNLLKYFPDVEYFLYTPEISSDKIMSKFSDNHALKTITPGTPFKSFWRSFSIVNRLLSDKIEIYHGLSGEVPFNIDRRKIKSVVTIHDLIFKVHPETYKPADRFLYNRKFSYACRNSDLIVAISESTKKDIIKYYGIEPDKIRVIYQACDPVYYSAPDRIQMEKTSKKYNLPADFLLYVGSVIPRKNLMTVVRALEILPYHVKIPLVIVGDGRSYKNEIKKYIAERGLEKFVIWIEDLHDSNHLKALYNMTRLFIYPSVYEGFGIPVVEALLSGTPVITSNLSSLPEAGGPDTLLVNPADTEQIANGIIKMLSDSAQREKMITVGLKYASEKFSSQALAHEMFLLYKQLLGNK